MTADRLLRWSCALTVLVGCVCVWMPLATAAAPPAALAGRWRLNRQLSEFPREIAFGIVTPDDSAAGAGRSGGGQTGSSGGRRGGSRTNGGSSRSLGGFDASSVRQSEEDVRKIDELIAEAKSPSSILGITQTDSTVTITDDQDRQRAFHPHGKEETVALAAGPVGATAKWNGPQLSVQLKIRADRVFHYVYARLPSGQLLVETRLEEGRSRDGAQVIKRIYDPADELPVALSPVK